MRIHRLTAEDLQARRAAALASLGMTLEQARAQWDDDCGCCLVDGNWHDLALLDEVKECDYLLGES